jgi:hypothetical protein
MRLKAGVEGLDDVLEHGKRQIAEAMTGAMKEATDGLKQELRDQLRAADLGPSMPTTWRGDVYPLNRETIDPTGYVWSKAPKIVSLLMSGAVVSPVSGKQYLWIPTSNVPRSSKGRPMRPDEVKSSFRSEFFYLPSRKTPGNLLAFVVPNSGARGGRSVSTRRRQAEPVHVFTLARQVQGKKVLDIDAPAQRWGARIPALVDKRMKGN